jgi:hypothetical protein
LSVNAFDRARTYGITVLFDDLGDWGGSELRSEYDPHRREIRINVRVAHKLHGVALDEFVELAVGHELYHHCEAIGEIAKLPERRAREAAADAFARELMTA